MSKFQLSSSFYVKVDSILHVFEIPIFSKISSILVKKVTKNLDFWQIFYLFCHFWLSSLKWVSFYSYMTKMRHLLLKFKELWLKYTKIISLKLPKVYIEKMTKIHFNEPQRKNRNFCVRENENMFDTSLERYWPGLCDEIINKRSLKKGSDPHLYP